MISIAPFICATVAANTALRNHTLYNQNTSRTNELNQCPNCGLKFNRWEVSIHTHCPKCYKKLKGDQK